MTARCLVCLLAAALACGGGTAKRVPAFPGAEGFGMYTPGGRGGKAVLVTSLRDYDPKREEPIPGSLRAACAAKGPRIVVFRVSGTVVLKTALVIAEPFLTLAGQSAPGDGICVSNASVMLGEGVHDVVIRHLRIRTGDTGPSKAPDSLAINSAHNVVVDHCSVSWGVDEVLSITAFPKQKGNAHDITIQWCIVSEGLRKSTHPKGAHSKGLMIAYGPTRITVHHNLIAHCNDRNPYLPTEGAFPYVVDVVNNVVYNWGSNAGIGYRKTNHNGQINFVGNHYTKGPNSRTRPCLTMGVDARVHARGNIGPMRTSLDQDEYLAVQWTGPQNRPGLRAEQRFDAPQVATHSCQEARGLVLAGAGATLPRRDAVDQRLVKEVETRTGRIIDHPSDVGGWPELRSAPPPADADNDGMPDQWEARHGLNPRDASDATGDTDADGYTNIEEWLNGTDPRKSDIPVEGVEGGRHPPAGGTGSRRGE